jgi:hypothetical protein
MTAPNSHHDRRNCARFSAILAVSLQPMRADRQPIGETCHGVSIDLSQSGISCFCDRPFTANYALVRVQPAASEAEMALFAKRVRCLRKGQFFEVALEFVEKLTIEMNPEQAP